MASFIFIVAIFLINSFSSAHPNVKRQALSEINIPGILGNTKIKLPGKDGGTVGVERQQGLNIGGFGFQQSSALNFNTEKGNRQKRQGLLIPLPLGSIDIQPNKEGADVSVNRGLNIPGLFGVGRSNTFSVGKNGFQNKGEAGVTLGEQKFGIAGQQGVGIGEQGGLSLNNQATPLLGGFEQKAKDFLSGLKNIFGGSSN